MHTLKQYRFFFITLLGIVAAYWLIDYAVAARQQQTVDQLMNVLTTHHTNALDVSETISRLGAHERADQLVSSCTTENLAEYNILLGRLSSNLSISELRTLDRHFGRCGYRNYQRRATQLLLLEAEVAQVMLAADTIALLTNDESYITRARLWQDVLQGETELTNQFKQLTEQQDVIIQSLLLGESANSPDIVAILESVRETRGAMAVRGIQLEEVRNQLATAFST
jgi:hypothetical protein